MEKVSLNEEELANWYAIAVSKEAQELDRVGCEGIRLGESRKLKDKPLEAPDAL